MPPSGHKGQFTKSLFQKGAPVFEFFKNVCIMVYPNEIISLANENEKNIGPSALITCYNQTIVDDFTVRKKKVILLIKVTWGDAREHAHSDATTPRKSNLPSLIHVTNNIIAYYTLWANRIKYFLKEEKIVMNNNKFEILLILCIFSNFSL